MVIVSWSEPASVVESQARDTASPGNCGTSVQIVQKDATPNIIECWNAMIVAEPATTLVHSAGNSMENVESVPTKNLISGAMSYAKNAMKYATS